MGKGVLQKWRRKFSDKREIAKEYFSLLSMFNKIGLTSKEIDMLSHIAIRGNIVSVASKRQFIELYNSTMPTINNIVSSLYKKKMLVKKGKDICLNPSINIDFSNKDVFIFNITCLFQSESKKE